MAALILALCLSTATASATCGTKSPPDYGDIEAVMLARNYDTEPHARPTRYRHTVPSIDRSTFWVLFWETGPAKFPTVYSQFDLQGMVGTYHLSAKLADAIAILRRDDFFNFRPLIT